MKKFKPNIVIGYPSAIKILAELTEKGEVELDVCRMISCGEPLGASLRSYLEKVFGTRAVNIYGAGESLAMGVEMNPEEGMLLFDDMNQIEVEDGVMYLTSLYNFAQPLIRYRLSDILTLQEADEKNRYPFTRAVGLLGRNEDLLWFEDGDGKKLGNVQFYVNFADEILPNPDTGKKPLTVGKAVNSMLEGANTLTGMRPKAADGS